LENYRNLFFYDNLPASITSINKLFIFINMHPLGMVHPFKKTGGICFSRGNWPLLNSLPLIFDYALKPLIDIKSISNNRAMEI
jgi:hypothetical protein